MVAINALERDLKVHLGGNNATRFSASSSPSKAYSYERSTPSSPSSRPQQTHAPKPQSPINKEKAAAIFVKSSWVPRNEEEVAYLEDEVRRIDKEITSCGGKMSKEGRKYEITRHGIIRRLQKYKAEQIRAARKSAAPPPPLPSEHQENAKPLTHEERKKLDRAAGWLKDKDKDQTHSEQEQHMVDGDNSHGNDNNSYSNSAYSMHTRLQHGDQQQHSATQLFANRQIAIAGHTGGSDCNNDHYIENDNSYNYDLRENVDSNSGPSSRDKNREAALRLVQLSERVESMKRANAEFAVKQQKKMITKQQQQQIQPVDRITGAHIKRGVGNQNYRQDGGASSAPCSPAPAGRSAGRLGR